MSVASSPNDCLRIINTKIFFKVKASSHMTKNTMIPTREKLIRIPAGPAKCKALPEPTNNPGPMMPANY
jgi:hypothetical protein